MCRRRCSRRHHRSVALAATRLTTRLRLRSYPLRARPHQACPTDYGVASAGSTWSAVTGPFGQLYVWGKLKLTGDTQMYPLAFMDLSGWNIRDMASGNQINVVAAEKSCIAWGTAQGYGELGYGAGGPKSSANPRKVDQLEDKNVIKVGAGLVSYMVIIDMSVRGPAGAAGD